MWNHYKTFKDRNNPRGLQKVQRPQSCSLGYRVLGDTEYLLFSPAPEALRRDTRGVGQGLSPGSYCS